MLLLGGDVTLQKEIAVLNPLLKKSVIDLYKPLGLFASLYSRYTSSSEKYTGEKGGNLTYDFF